MEAQEAQVVSNNSEFPELKPIHIVVMIITLLHAVAIGVWFLVFIAGSKGKAFVHYQYVNLKKHLYNVNLTHCFHDREIWFFCARALEEQR